jgi:hypothetical protein
VEAWTAEISSNLDLETSDLSFEKEFVAPIMAAAVHETHERDS